MARGMGSGTAVTVHGASVALENDAGGSAINELEASGVS